jgi:hypothetical protein
MVTLSRSRINTLLKVQVLPIFLAALAAAALVGFLWLEICVLNFFTDRDVSLRLHAADVLLGVIIYLKTSVDFAVFIARLMESNGGLGRRVAIELGTAAGNAVGTLCVLAVWVFFKEVRPLLAFMILIAALVLFRLAEDGLDHVQFSPSPALRLVARFSHILQVYLRKLNRAIAPVLKYVVPKIDAKDKGPLRFWPLFWFSCSIPFILGLDDFAGYVPLFSLVNVFGFAFGVIIGHMLLTMVLFVSPATTIRIVSNPFVGLVGSVAFIGLAIWGIVEVVHLLL